MGDNGKIRRRFSGIWKMLVTLSVMLMTLTACADMTSRPLSVDSMAGRYDLYPEAIKGANEVLSQLGSSGIPEVRLDLGEDGTGRLTMSKDGKDTETKNLRWRLDGGSRRPEILLTLTDPISPDDKWVAFLMTLESDPSHTKIKGSVSEGEIRLRQSESENGDGLEFVFTKVAGDA